MTTNTVLALATHNKGKTAEIEELLKNYPVDIRNLDEFGPIPAIVEDGDTFEENAYKKASQTARYLGIPALADDSGLIVEALGGAPGVHTARYAGPNATDLQLYEKLLLELGDSHERAAHFMCVISIAVPSGPALTYEASCDGIITEEPMGSNGFGFDPVFFYPPLEKTFAQLTRQEKSRVSHRGKALAQVCSEFDKVITWLRQQTMSNAAVDCLGRGHDC